MAAGDLITKDKQYEFNGLLMGADTAYQVFNFIGLEDMPSVRASDRFRALRHGEHRNDHFLMGRDFVMEMLVKGETEAGLRSALEDLADAMVIQQDELPFVYRIPQATFTKSRINARIRRRAFPIDNTYMHGHLARVALEFHATDPRIYDNVEQSLSTGITEVTSGWSMPWSSPWDLGGTGESSSVTATNAGNRGAPHVVRFNGPATRVEVESVEQSKMLEVATTLLDGQFLELDTLEQTILLNGTASRYGDLTAGSNWFDLQPGVNTLVFRSTTTGAPTMDVTWRSARE